MFNLDTIKARLEAQTCPEHHQHPAITVAEDSVSIAACCEPFHRAMNGMLENEIEASISKIMEEALRAMEAVPEHSR